MQLTQLRKGEKGVIKSIQADKSLRDRFLSFGIMQGETLEVVECSLGKKTIEILIGQTSIALRAQEAEKIIVEKLGVLKE